MTRTQPTSADRGFHATPSLKYRLPGYPTVYRDSGGKRITIRPMVPTDCEALLAFFQRIPPGDRLYLKDDVVSPDVIGRWAETLDYRRALPLLALVGHKIVGDGTLHRDPARSGRHTGEVRIVIDPAYRSKGLGRFLLRRLIDEAKRDDRELKKVIFEIVADTERAAQHAARALGFAPIETFSAYVHYYAGTPHDLVLMELRLQDIGTEETDDPASHMF